MRLYHRYLNIYRTKQTGWQYSDIILCTHLQMTTLPVVHLVGCVQRCVKNTVCSRDFSVHTLQVHRPLKMSHNFPILLSVHTKKSINNGWQTDGRRQLRSGTVWRGQMGAVTVCRQPSLSQGQFALRDTWVPETLWSETLWNRVHFGAETLWHKRHFDTKYTLTQETLWCQIHFGAMENPKKYFFQ